MKPGSMLGLGFPKYRYVYIGYLLPPIMENQMEKKMENEMETGSIGWFIRIGGFPKLRVPFWGPHIKDCSIWGSILGSHACWKLPGWLVGWGRKLQVAG